MFEHKINKKKCSCVCLFLSVCVCVRKTVSLCQTMLQREAENARVLKRHQNAHVRHALHSFSKFNNKCEILKELCYFLTHIPDFAANCFCCFFNFI